MAARKSAGFSSLVAAITPLSTWSSFTIPTGVWYDRVGRSFVQARATPCYLCCLLIVACSIVPLQPVVESQTLTGADGRPGWRSLWLRPPHGVAELTKKTGPRCATIETALTLSGRWRPIDLRYADTPTDATTPLSIHHRHNFRTPSNNKTDHPPHSLSNETPHFTTE